MPLKHYGATALFQEKTFSQVNARRKKLYKKLWLRNECLDFSRFMTGKVFSISAGLFCFAAIFLTAIPAIVSLLTMKLYQPEPITYSNITLFTDSRANADIRKRDIILLWVALGFMVAAAISMVLYGIASALNENLRGRKINIKDLLSELAAVPQLESDATVEAIKAADDLLQTIETSLSSHELHDVENGERRLLVGAVSL